MNIENAERAQSVYWRKWFVSYNIRTTFIAQNLRNEKKFWVKQHKNYSQMYLDMENYSYIMIVVLQLLPPEDQRRKHVA